MRKVYNCISSIRKQKSITQKQLAALTGTTSRTLRKWEKGLEYPGVDKAFLIADILEVPLTTLFFNIDSDNP